MCQPLNLPGTIVCPTGSNCCALAMWTDSDFKKLTIEKCTERLWQVCVVEELSFQAKLIAIIESMSSKGLQDRRDRVN